MGFIAVTSCCDSKAASNVDIPQHLVNGDQNAFTVLMTGAAGLAVLHETKHSAGLFLVVCYVLLLTGLGHSLRSFQLCDVASSENLHMLCLIVLPS